MSDDDRPVYIYERVDDTIYARQPGGLHRIKISQPSPEIEFEIWKDIWRLSKENTNNGILIRDLLDRLLVAYHLIKK